MTDNPQIDDVAKLVMARDYIRFAWRAVSAADELATPLIDSTILRSLDGDCDTAIEVLADAIEAMSDDRQSAD